MLQENWNDRRENYVIEYDIEYVILQYIQVRSGDIVPFLFKILIFPQTHNW